MTVMADRVQVTDADGAELLYEIAVTLLPLIGRCVELSAGEMVARHGNRLDSPDDRRLIIADIARRWERLGYVDRGSFGRDWRAAVAAFTVDYVDAIEAEAPGSSEYEQWGHEATIALVWHQHAERLRAE
ncbi:hypothetical protein OHA72_12105 [Dactylosporangium sp. NBC_01737]|uniref:hypothetical protein n=1 Tax=Dactylosporangium sp. NBC_01737 TaxID=2975959 RepID=UPI002E11BBC2|nr:hypothetical protein OHA72_12105 [Dactylosporangium sp. NBC_01737]